VQAKARFFAINNNAEPTLATLRYKLRAFMGAAEEASKPSGKKFNRGRSSSAVRARRFRPRRQRNRPARPFALSAAPTVKTHPVRAARVAFVHTWLGTQTEGWWRLALDNLKIPTIHQHPNRGEER